MTAPNPASTDPGRRKGFGAGVLVVAALKFLVHVVFVNQYAVFRDELYYLDCARHLAWGYVDQPPLIAAIGFLTLPFEPSLLALRLPVILAGVGLVLLTAAGSGRELEAAETILVSAERRDRVAEIVHQTSFDVGRFAEQGLGFEVEPRR